MADVNISKYTTQVVREGSKPASPGFVVSEGQDPVNPPGTNNYVPYSGATANVELGEFGLETGFVTLDTTPTNIPTEQGGIYWDDSRSTAALIMNGTLQHIGQDVFYYVKNSSGSSIPKGTAVRFNGTDGASGHLLIAPFLADGTYPSTYFMGVTAETIGNGSFGQVMHFGELSGINTSGYTAGALLYASTTVAGGFQTTAPVAPNNIVLIAAAVNSKDNGEIIVRPTYGSNINTDEGIKITSVADKDFLQYQSGTGLWENKTLAQVIGSAYVPSTRTITINGTTQDLSADRTFSVGDMLLDTIQTVTARKDYNNNTLQLVVNGTSQKTVLSNSPIDTGSYSLAINFFGFNASNNLYFSKGGNNNGIIAFSNTATRTYTLKDASGTLAFTSDIPTNPVGGTGTTNYLPKFTGASTIGNSVVIESTNYIGIGISPSATLHVNANNSLNEGVAAAIIRQSGASGNNGIVVDVTNTPGIYIADFRQNNSSLVRIASNGNLLVGTTTDAGFKLDVNGAGRFSGILNLSTALQFRYNGVFRGQIIDYNSYGGGGDYSPFFTSETSLAFGVGGNAIKALNIASTGAATFSGLVTTNTVFRIVQASVAQGGLYTYNQVLGSGTDYSIGLQSETEAFIATGGTTTKRLTITSGGNVMIGTTTDNGFKLRVNGGSYLEGSVYSPYTYGNTSGGAANLGISSSGEFYRSTSSIKYKKEVKDYLKGLNEVMKMRPVSYYDKNDNLNANLYAGLIAEEIDNLGLKEFVQYSNDGKPDALSYSNMISILVKAIQELKQEIDTLKN